MLRLANPTKMTYSQSFGTLVGIGPYARDAAPYKLLEVVGPDAGEFLQRLCTQDLKRLAEGLVTPLAMLDAKGKLQVTAMALRHGESFWLETQAPQAERLLASLERYHFSEKLTIHSRDLGPVHEVICLAGSQSFVGKGSLAADASSLTLHVERRGVTFVRCHGLAVAASELVALGCDPEQAIAPLLPELAEAARMLAGFVRVGLESEASTLALEADLDDHCSTNTGCYTGQEIVARIHTYGHVNRKLCLLRLALGDAITEPVALHECEDDLAVGRVLHAVPLAEHGIRLGLGYLPTDFQAVGTKLTLAGDGEVEVVGYAEAAS